MATATGAAESPKVFTEPWPKLTWVMLPSLQVTQTMSVTEFVATELG